MNVSAIGGQFLFTGLLHYVRNDKRARIIVIASKRSDAWQSSLFYVARSALTLLSALCALLSEIKNGAFVKTVFRMTARIDVRGRIRSCATANPN